MFGETGPGEDAVAVAGDSLVLEGDEDRGIPISFSSLSISRSVYAKSWRFAFIYNTLGLF